MLPSWFKSLVADHGFGAVLVVYVPINLKIAGLKSKVKEPVPV
jgi:hypothetical protein